MRTPAALWRLYRLWLRMRYGSADAAKARKHARKHARRRRRFESERWEHGEIAQRRYACYAEYLRHQAEKLDRQYERRVEKEERVALDDFRRRFAACAALGEARNVLCIGARLGAEVQALHELGHFAVGIDLNPGPDNPYVLPGDLHDLVFPDASVDAVYTNVLDHVFELDRALAEIARVLRPGGVFVADILPGYEEGFTPGEYESTHWRTASGLVERICETGGFRCEQWRELEASTRHRWMQVVLRAPEAEAVRRPRRAAVPE